MLSLLPIVKPRRPTAALIGTAGAGLATLVRAALTPFLGTGLPYVIHLPAVAVVTWIGGAVAGMVAIAVGALSVDAFIVKPEGGILVGGDPLARVLPFALVSLVLVWQVHRWRNSVVGVQRLMEQSGRREAELRALMDAATESIWLIARDGTILACNTTAAARFASTPDALIGTRWQTLVPPELVAVRETRFAEGYATGEPVRFEDERGGVRFDHSLYPVRDPDGSLRATAVFSRDVTHERRLENELRHKAVELDRANRLKDEFLATLSHELRTPMNAILGWSRILTTTDAPEEMRRRGLVVIAQNAATQTRLIEDVLDMSRIVTGTFRVDRQPVAIAGIVGAALESVGPAARAKDIRVTVTAAAEAIVMGDAARLQQVLWNLLMNAVKFTPPGGLIEIGTRVAALQAIIDVRDTGIGIAPEFLPRVFDRFSQADPSVTREHAGLGIGLSIVRHIVDLHGGSVAVASDGPGRGATFTVTLPVQDGQD